MGTPDFSVPTLELLYSHPLIELINVISMPDRPAGRGKNLQSPPVITFAKEKKIAFHQSENINKDDEFFNRLKDIDLIIVLAFAQFLSKKWLDLPAKGCFNIHTSLLPKYRGAAPIQHAILNGDTSTGVCIQKMVKKMDAGDIAIQKIAPISKQETGGSLYTRLKFLSVEALNDFLYQLENDSLSYIQQNENQVSFAPSLKKEDGFLEFKNLKTEEALNKIRALQPWPGTYFFLDKKRVKLFSAVPSGHKLSPGDSKVIENNFIIGCVDGSLEIRELQLEGKKRCMARELLNGLKDSFVINP